MARRWDGRADRDPGRSRTTGDQRRNGLDLPGHAPGQLGAVVRNADGTTWLLAADAVWSRASLEPEAAGARLSGLVHRLLARDREAQEETCERLRRLRRERPDLVVIPAHCREAAAELLSAPGGDTGGRART